MRPHNMYFFIGNFFLGLSLIAHDVLSRFALLVIGMMYVFTSFSCHKRYIRIMKMELHLERLKLMETQKRRRRAKK